jgi:alpha-N-acetylglucosamine transferase
MKVLVQQVFCGEGIMSADFTEEAENDKEFVTDICMPSVRKYAEENGYDYHLQTSTPDSINKMPILNEGVTYYFKRRLMRMSFIKYLMLEKYKQYDYILLLDSDVLVGKNTPLPLEKGLTTSNIDWPMATQLQRRSNRIVIVNAGFLLFDAECAKTMYRHITASINDIVGQRLEEFHDESELAYMMNDNMHIPHNELDHRWNHWGSMFGNADTLGYIPECHFYHWVGKDKLNRFNQCVKNGWFDTDGNYIPK